MFANKIITVDTLQDNRMPQLSDPELEKAEKFTTDASPPSSFPAEDIDPRNPKVQISFSPHIPP